MGWYGSVLKIIDSDLLHSFRNQQCCFHKFWVHVSCNICFVSIFLEGEGGIAVFSLFSKGENKNGICKFPLRIIYVPEDMDC
jgi:hypothetical protein